METNVQDPPSNVQPRRLARGIGVGLTLALVWVNSAQLTQWLSESLAWLLAWPARLETRYEGGDGNDTLLLLLVGLLVVGFGIGRHPSPPG